MVSIAVAAMIRQVRIFLCNGSVILESLDEGDISGDEEADD